jgi:hypothetical protein
MIRWTHRVAIATLDVARQGPIMTTPKPANPIPATLIPGDGIGPEITDAVVAILGALGSPFAWDIQQGGMAAIAAAGDPLPPTLLDSIRRTKLALKVRWPRRLAAAFARSTYGCAKSSSCMPTCGRRAR